jgi:alpha-L-rhamnosidase
MKLRVVVALAWLAAACGAESQPAQNDPTGGTGSGSSTATGSSSSSTSSTGATGTTTYLAMVKWVEHVKGANPTLLWQMQRGNDYGDWLSIADDTDKELLATAFFAHSADLVSRAAKILKNDAEATKYATLFSSIKDAFDRAYVGADGKIKSDTQTVYALAIRFGPLPDPLRAPAAKFLADNVARHTRPHVAGKLRSGQPDLELRYVSVVGL